MNKETNINVCSLTAANGSHCIRRAQQRINTNSIQLSLSQTSCVLSFFNKTDENIIISARLPDDPALDPVKMFDKEKVSN